MEELTKMLNDARALLAKGDIDGAFAFYKLCILKCGALKKEGMERIYSLPECHEAFWFHHLDTLTQRTIEMTNIYNALLDEQQKTGRVTGKLEDGYLSKQMFLEIASHFPNADSNDTQFDHTPMVYSFAVKTMAANIDKAAFTKNFFGLLPTFFEIPPKYMDAFGHIVEADMMNWFVTRVAEGDKDIRKYWASLTHVVALAQKDGRGKICRQIEMKRDLANAAIAAIGMNETIVDLCKEVIAMRHSLWSYKHPDDKKQTTWYDTMICQIKEYDPEYQAPVFTVWHAPCVSIGSPPSPYLSAGD